MISLFGYGSLISEDSARSTCPNLQNFHHVYAKDVARIFGKVNLQSLLRGEGNLETMEVSPVILVEKEDALTYGCSFDIPVDEWPAIKAREFDYGEGEITVFDIKTHTPKTVRTFFGLRTDDDIPKNTEMAKAYWHDTRQHYQGKIYRNDVLPEPLYLKRCLDAFKQVGIEMYDNFLDQTYLADGKTTIRNYLSKQSRNL